MTQQIPITTMMMITGRLHERIGRLEGALEMLIKHPSLADREAIKRVLDEDPDYYAGTLFEEWKGNDGPWRKAMVDAAKKID